MYPAAEEKGVSSALRWILKRLIASPEDIPLHTILPWAKRKMELASEDEANSILPRWSFNFFFCRGYALPVDSPPTNLKFSSWPNHHIDQIWFVSGWQTLETQRETNGISSTESRWEWRVHVMMKLSLVPYLPGPMLAIWAHFLTDTDTGCFSLLTPVAIAI